MVLIRRFSSALLVLVFGLSESAFGEQRRLDCPAPPQQIARDVTVDTKGKVAGLGKLKVGELENKTEVLVKPLLDNTPNSDRFLMAQMMTSVFCQVLSQSDLSDKEKLDRFDAFYQKVLTLLTTAPVNPPAAQATTTTTTTSARGKLAEQEETAAAATAKKKADADAKSLIGTRILIEYHSHRSDDALAIQTRLRKMGVVVQLASQDDGSRYLSVPANKILYESNGLEKAAVLEGALESVVPVGKEYHVFNQEVDFWLVLY